MLGLTVWSRPCGAGVGAGKQCGATPTRPYTRGARCQGHQPQPVNPTPDPALTVDGLRTQLARRRT